MMTLCPDDTETMTLTVCPHDTDDNTDIMSHDRDDDTDAVTRDIMMKPCLMTEMMTLTQRLMTGR